MHYILVYKENKVPQGHIQIMSVMVDFPNCISVFILIVQCQATKFTKSLVLSFDKDLISN